MKLSMICEVIDSVIPFDIDHDTGEEFLASCVIDGNLYEFEAVYNVFNDRFEVYLKGPSHYSSTGLGNHFKVYSFLFSAIKHLIDTRVVSKLHFRGSEAKMDRVYFKLLNKLGKLGSKYKFVKYKGDTWLNQELYLDDESLKPSYQNSVKKETKKHKKYLDDIKKW